MGQQVFRETVKSRIGPHIVESDVEPVGENVVKAARQRYKETGRCDHSLIVDESGFLYDIRSCAVCGVGLGAV
jgi:hypothetical protein